MLDWLPLLLQEPSTGGRSSPTTGVHVSPIRGQPRRGCLKAGQRRSAPSNRGDPLVRKAPRDRSPVWSMERTASDPPCVPVFFPCSRNQPPWRGGELRRSPAMLSSPPPKFCGDAHQSAGRGRRGEERRDRWGGPEAAVGPSSLSKVTEGPRGVPRRTPTVARFLAMVDGLSDHFPCRRLSRSSPSIFVPDTHGVIDPVKWGLPGGPRNLRSAYQNSRQKVTFSDARAAELLAEGGG